MNLFQPTKIYNLKSRILLFRSIMTRNSEHDYHVDFPKSTNTRIPFQTSVHTIYHIQFIKKPREIVFIHTLIDDNNPLHVLLAGICTRNCE